MGREVLQLIDNSFPPDNPLHKLFNRNTVKVSYKCMPNIGQAISRHNSRLKKEEHPQPEPGCNCRGGVDTCPANGQCKKDSVVYRAFVTIENGNTEFLRPDSEVINQVSTIKNTETKQLSAPTFGN